jgi:DHA1 family multidrug resistance protein-like MFS transporter
MLNIQSLRQRFHFIRGNYLVITLTRILGMFSRNMVFPYASLFILALNGDSTQIGWVNAVKPLAGLLMFPIAGYLTDHVGRVKLIAAGGYFSGAVVLMFVLAPNWQVVALASLIQGFMVLSFPPESALIADSLSPEDRGTGLATMNTATNALAMFSPLVAGTIIDAAGEEFGIRVLYAVMVILYLASAAINHRFLKETSVSASKIDWTALPKAFTDAYSGVSDMLKKLPRALRVHAAIVILGFTCNAVAGAFWVVYADQEIGLSAMQWGSILFVESLLRTLLLIPAGIAIDRYGRARFILASLALSLVATPAFVLSSTFLHVLLIRIVMGVANAFFAPASMAFMADAIPRQLRGRAMAAIGRGFVQLAPASGGTGGPGTGFLTTLPMIVGSIAGGYLYRYNPVLPWIFVFGVTVVSIVLATLFLRDPEHAHV